MTEADDEDYDSVDSSEASDQAKVEAARGHMTDDSGIDSITVSPTREAGGMMETLLTMAMAGKKHRALDCQHFLYKWVKASCM